MRFDFRTLSKAISTLVVLCVLFLGMAIDTSAQRRGRDWGRSHNRGRHLGWTRGRRVGQFRRDDNNRRWRRHMRRDRRDDRRRYRRFDRRSNWNDRRDWQSARWRNRY